MTTAQMRAALAAHERFVDQIPVRKLNVDSAPGKPDAATEAHVDKAAGKSKHAKAKDGNKGPSVKQWLAAQLDKHGSVDVEKAKAWVASTGRSNVTLYRQAGELKLKLDRTGGAWRAK